ncbi:DUF2793 domain-containing protein [Phaeovulum sp.]|uniref:DUF2793 domain-containing protein n=1 Tax=Phaeovulum sp. TaxID=2934796 RepID=UPI002ABBB7C4|nr:DUF2793 domain-containing protein [Phaeovulum sp.]MDZ4118022.1 DUF2793 domain-containing protein [Phaeovulum sp.]
MADTPNLVLPYLAANQSQKHVTVNEALRRLDALVQVTVQSAVLATPPGSPTEGQRWIIPAAPTGAWAGHAGQIAAWQDGAWAFYAPLDGWTAVDVSTDMLLLYNAGTGIWTGLITGVFTDAAFTLQDDIDPTKLARFQIAGFTAGATRVFTLPDATTSLAGLAVAQTFSAKQTLSNANNDLGTSTGTGTTNLATGATLNGSAKTVNIGTAGVSGSTTNLTIGSAVAGALGTLTINSPTVTFGSSVSAIAMAAANVSALYLSLGGASADATNRLSINAPASLFNHAGAGHQVKVNKAAATDTGSFLFQTGFSGRAEFGLTGSDDFQIKVSADGATWFNALQLERTSGRVRAMVALQLNPNAGDPGTVADGDLWYNSSTGKFRGRQGGVSLDLAGGAAATAAYGVLQANFTLTSATTAQKLFNWSTNGALSLAAGTYRFSCSLLLTSMSATSGSAKFDLKGAGSAIFGKMSMQDFGSRGTVAVGGTTATSGTASDVPTSGGVLATAATSAALRASIHGTFEITTAGTIIPSIALDVAAAAVVNAGSYFECIYLGPTAALGGSWS